MPPRSAPAAGRAGGLAVAGAAEWVAKPISTEWVGAAADEAEVVDGADVGAEAEAGAEDWVDRVGVEVVEVGGQVVEGGGEAEGAQSTAVSGACTRAVGAGAEAEAEAGAEAEAEAGAEAEAEAARSAAEEARAAEEAPPFQSNFEAACHRARIEAEARAAAALLEAPRSIDLPRD